MNPPRLTLCLLALIGALVLHAAAPAADSDLEKVQGDWKATMETPDGEQKVSMSVKEKRLQVDGPKPLGAMTVSFELDWNAKPKRMSMVIEECEVDQMKGLTIEAIYTLEKKVWTLCATAPGSPEGPSGFDDEKARTVEFRPAE